MKILLVNYEYPGTTSNCGGGGEVTRQLETELVRRGHTVRVYTDQADGNYTTFPLRHYRGLKRVLERYQPDVVNAHFSMPTGLPLARLCEQRDIPLVTSVMGADLYDPTRYQHIRPLLDHINRYVFERSDAIVAPSRDMLDRLPPLFLHNSRVVHYGIEPEHWNWEPGTERERTRLLTVCRLVPRKNLDLAIATSDELRRRGHDIEHTIVGKGPERAGLLEEHGDKDWLSLPGYVEDLDAVYNDHDVFVLPSKHEAFGMVFLEALASGLPVVTSDTGGQTDIIENGVVGEIAQPNVEDQTAAVERLLDSYLRQQASTRHYVEAEWTADRMAAEYEQVYEGVV